ncbi:hypothetical protein [Streptomyces sp. NPDC091268]|uniref:hypothetical protein n=1 Tax=Streptomyces sp. NPDC091268 TaxID=3365979 RepID=UPI003818C6BA
MDEIPWFEYDEDDLDVAQRVFVDVLAERAGSWLVDPLDTVVLPSAHTFDGRLIVYLDIGDPQHNRGVLTVGAHFDGSVIRGGKLHNQDFAIQQAWSEFVFESAGSPRSWGSERRSGSKRSSRDLWFAGNGITREGRTRSATSTQTWGRVSARASRPPWHPTQCGRGWLQTAYARPRPDQP